MKKQITRNTIVTLDYNVTAPDGELVDAGKEPLVYLHGGYDDIFPTIEEALQGKKIGETVVVKMQPDEAFGEYDADLVEVEPRKDFPRELQVGMQLEGLPEDAHEEEARIYRVTEITDDKVVLDGNHPLAGMALIFTCTVTAIRPASTGEIAHGHHHDGDCDCDCEAED
jgi:FKBP-type peptidyl-prolyl cis-trans isomerase SlyD